MPGWTGTGTFQRVYSWVSDAAAGIDIIASRVDQDTDNITTNGFNNCLTRDGQGSATGNLPMNAFRHTGASDGVDPQDYVTVAQITGGGGSTIIPAGAYLGEIRSTALTEALIATLMPGWHVCSGVTRPRTDPLWVAANVGWSFGTGDGMTTYTLPDLRGRAPFGKDNMGGSAANRLTFSSGIGGTTLGASGGNELAQQHTHTVTDPQHTHPLNDPTHNHPVNDFGHSHSEIVVAPTGTQGTFGANADFTQGTAGTTGSATTGITTGSVVTGTTMSAASTNISLVNSGAGTSQNMPPALVFNYVIFVGA